MVAVQKRIVRAEYTTPAHDVAVITLEGEGRSYTISKHDHPSDWAEMHQSIQLRHYSADAAANMPPVASGRVVDSEAPGITIEHNAAETVEPQPTPVPQPTAFDPAPIVRRLDAVEARVGGLEQRPPPAPVHADTSNIEACVAGLLTRIERFEAEVRSRPIPQPLPANDDDADVPSFAARFAPSGAAPQPTPPPVAPDLSGIRHDIANLRQIVDAIAERERERAEAVPAIDIRASATEAIRRAGQARRDAAATGGDGLLTTTLYTLNYIAKGGDLAAVGLMSAIAEAREIGTDDKAWDRAADACRKDWERFAAVCARTHAVETAAVRAVQEADIGAIGAIRDAAVASIEAIEG